MTASASLAFPGSRALAGWWRQLASYRPEALWVGHLFLHHVEALARIRQPYRPDRFSLLVLQALTLDSPPQLSNNGAAADSPEAALQLLEERLHLGRQVLWQALRSLATQGLAQSDGRGRWSPTDPGRRALQGSELHQDRYERRVFHFVDREPPRDGSVEPAFVPLATETGVPWKAAADWSFDPAALHLCLTQPDEWKQGCGFPAEVVAILGPDVSAAGAEGVPAWQRIVTDRPEHVITAVARLPGAANARQLVGFAVQQEGWALAAKEPAFSLRETCADALAELRQPPPTAAWREAWLQWCQQRCLPEGEADGSRLEPEGVRLLVQAPARLLERLRAARSDVLKGEAWLLVGEGRFRRAVRLDVVAT